MPHVLYRIGTFVAALFAVVYFVGCSAEGSPGPSAPDDEEEASTAIAGYELEPRDLSRRVQVSGTVESVERIRIKSHVGAVLKDVAVEEGDEVSAGQPVAISELGEMRAERRRAAANLTKLEGQYSRMEPLVETQAVRRAELEDLEAEIEVANSEVELWDTRIDLARMTAPRDAVVAERHVDPGGYVQAGEPIADLVDLSTLVVPVTLSERDVVAVDTGDGVELTVDAHPDRTLEASIRRIFPTADAQSRRVVMELAVDEIPEDMVVKPGFRARAVVEVDPRPNILAVPDESLLASPPDDRFVYLVDDGELVRRRVTTGVERRNLTEITDGLEEGDVIVGTNPTNLSEGMSVHVTQWVDHGE